MAHFFENAGAAKPGWPAVAGHDNQGNMATKAKSPYAIGIPSPAGARGLSEIPPQPRQDFGEKFVAFAEGKADEMVRLAALQKG